MLPWSVKRRTAPLEAGVGRGKPAHRAPGRI
jgi:hypothetical protein